ncbi:tetratricopeptide repeat protein [Rhodopseudomonas sp. NSM]|uniref:tetratricopeptide repeat protein n=1 Tax=Rhodopseudomonas sp. NSM TaxID=3457630 RepID=UPI0040357FD7
MAVATLVVLFGAGFVFHVLESPGEPSKPTQTSSASFVGSDTCVGCHQTEARLWNKSQHKAAMQHATESSVLGDFNDQHFDHFGVRSRFFRQNGKFMVEAEGPDGKLATFEAKYTFGIYPLQQYLIEFPDGRLQALSIAWDTRPKDKGGQRWFHLYPDERIGHDDALHWTRLNQNWNFMCAECHSTGVRKNYEAASDRFKTSWAEISVGCEACHGQGSRHVGWAHAQQSWWPIGISDDATMGLLVRYAERNNITWRLDPKTGNSTRSSPPATLRTEVESCGLCHARRGQLSEDWVPGRWLSDTHAVSPLSRGLYHADGQMRDEVYNYGSFKQSKMYTAGVTCSDCHDPHSGKLWHDGDNVCLQCHAAEKFSSATHHRHAAAQQALPCKACHMPVRTYMGVDQRHDHGFRIPRPDVSAQLDTPNTCNDCHSNRSPQWAADAIEAWHGSKRKGFQTFAPAFAAAWDEGADASRLLAAVATDPATPDIVRATALTEISSHPSPQALELAKAGLANPDPMVRIAALDLLEGVPPAQRWATAAPRLSDPARGVRIRAASLLVAVPTDQQPSADRQWFAQAAEEFVAAQRLNADRPEARSALGRFLLARGQAAAAEIEYKAALRLSPHYAPAAVNLADLYRQSGREIDGETVLREALTVSPQDAGLHHGLGLTLVRLKRHDEAISELHQAAELAPDRTRFAYVYAVALQAVGRVADAVAILKQSAARHPHDRDTLMALVAYSRAAGDIGTAITYAERLAADFPDDAGLGRLVQEIRQQSTRPTSR